MSDGWEFKLDGEGPQEIPGIPDRELQPILNTQAKWENYSDHDTYRFDKLVREFIETMSKDPKWRGSAKLRRYTMAMVWVRITATEWTSRENRYAARLSKILAYYSTKVQKGGMIGGKAYSKTIYTLSPARLKKPPYSLKLRLEWLAERGELPTASNMDLPRDDLKPGHARNPRTERNMERRREDGKRRYRERYRDRSH